MDRVGEYRALIKRILNEYAQYKLSFGDAEIEVIVDDAGGHYQLWHVGWDGNKRIHFCVLHVDLKGDKIWIQHDGIEDGITQDLLDAGVPPEHIVLAFHAPNERKLTPFAVA